MFRAWSSDSLTSLRSPQLPGSFAGGHNGSVHLLPLGDVSMGAHKVDGLAVFGTSDAAAAMKHPSDAGGGEGERVGRGNGGMKMRGNERE